MTEEYVADKVFKNAIDFLKCSSINGPKCGPFLTFLVKSDII